MGFLIKASHCIERKGIAMNGTAALRKEKIFDKASRLCQISLEV